MSKKANPALIGAFVFGAILLAFGALIFFGAANLFTKKAVRVSFFDQSVSGLAVGSNVKFKGVTIGKVSRVVLAFRGEGKPAFVKVFYEIDPTVVERGLGTKIDLFDEKLNERRIQDGLRAKLDFESLISGQLYLALDFFKNPAPAVFHKEYLEGNVFEIPVQPSDIEAILGNLTKAISNLGNIDFLSISKDLQSLLTSTREGIDSMKLDQLGASLTRTSDSVSNLVNSEDVKGALASVHQAFEQLNITLKKLETETLAKNLNPTLEQAKATMTQLQASTAELNRMLKPNSGFRYQLDSSLSQIGAAADALQRLSEFLERNPNSILFGRKPGQSAP
ncbi:MAG: MlaD family protein [Chthoniobacterales bacterium]|jgi:phospholipid/cholesterol/gamma-HCH transport system substrate-binding protein